MNETNERKNVNIDVNRIKIFSSYYGAISRINDPAYNISVIDNNSALDVEKWSEMCRRVANNGANSIREMCYWIEKPTDRDFSPYYFNNGKYYLDNFNQRYFDNLRKMVLIANAYNLTFYFSLYESCGMKPKTRNVNPWYLNHNKVTHFNQRKAAQYRIMWENKVLETLSGLKVGYELCNEPTVDEKDLLFTTFKRLRLRDVAFPEIILGVENETRPYRKFRNLIIEEFGEEEYNKKIKHESFSSIHNVSEKTFKHLELQEGHTRRYFISADGTHPKRNKIWWQTQLTEFFEEVPTAAFRNEYGFEAMHKRMEDDFDSVLGIVEALNHITNRYPENYGRYPVTLPFTDKPKPAISPAVGEAVHRDLREYLNGRRGELLEKAYFQVLGEFFSRYKA